MHSSRSRQDPQRARQRYSVYNPYGSRAAYQRNNPHQKPVKGHLVNHVLLLLDSSSSMLNDRSGMKDSRAEQLIKVADAQVQFLAERSQQADTNQETRITVATFGFPGDYQVLVWDMDVMRLPSIADLYHPYGNTAMAEGVIHGLDDLALIPEQYGDHAFLVYVLTDGEENASSEADKRALPVRIEALPVNWTVACLVPDEGCARDAERFGFPHDNISVWDVNSVNGVLEVGKTIQDATERFMVGRSQGIRSTRTLFSTGADAINTAAIADAELKALRGDQYLLVAVDRISPIREFVEQTKEFADRGVRTYVSGRAFYQLSKTETIQPQKALAIVNKRTGEVFVGDEVRGMVGLSTTAAERRAPNFNPEFDLFVQSTSVNRKLVVGTRLLYLAR